MSDLTDISMNIAIGGCSIDSSYYEAFKKQVGMIVGNVIECMEKFNHTDYGYSGSKGKVDLFSSPFLADEFWTDFAEDGKMPLNVITPYNESNDRYKILDKAFSVTNINIGRSCSAGSGSVMADWIADQSDIAVLLWDGREDFNNREVWALIQACRRNNIPCIWIDVHSPEKVFWSMDSYYDTFTEDKLQKYVSALFSKNSGIFDPPGKSRIPFWRLWHYLYNRFMKKYKAKIQPLPYIVDKVLDKNPKLPGDSLSGESILRKIVDRFHYYDSNAIEYSQKYRTSIYARSIIPFIAAVFIAFGSFAENVLGFFYKWPFSISPWAILASIGFLTNGLIFFYIYKLSENSDLSSWHPRFIDNRFVAEVLRLMAHFSPYGIPINFSSSLNRFGSKISKNPHVFNEIRRSTRNMEFSSVTFNRDVSDKLLNNLTDMVNDQIIYHEYSIERYEAIISGLKKFTAILFAVGLTVVVSRGCLQFVLIYVDIGAFQQNGIQFESFIKSIINMFALIFPAWASYFSLKLSLSNFEGLMSNSVEMKKYLTVMRNILDGELKRDDISFERIYLFSRELTKLMLGEVADWYSQISTQRFTKL